MRLLAYANIDIPWVAWLVYRGEMVSAQSASSRALSIWHTNYLLNSSRNEAIANRYARECVLEAVRARQFPTTVSRLTGMYFLDDEVSARRAGSLWDCNFKEQHLIEVDVDDTSKTSRYDAQWISRKLDTDENNWITDYFAGKPYSQMPIWERLVDGRGIIIGTGVRKLAYETVKREWPKSLGLLELARVAAELNSDLGLILPMVVAEGDVLRLKLYLDFQDATNPEFLERLGRFDGPKNTCDLNANADLVTPDLSPYTVSLMLTSNPENTTKPH